MFLGIEIGGTKLQLGVAAGDRGEFVDFRRLTVDAGRGAAGIREQIASAGKDLLEKHSIERIGIGFGGPIQSESGITTKSHQIDGWENFPLKQWCEQQLGKETVLGNDCDVATLAEAKYGAGRGSRSVFFLTVGTGVGGGFVIDGKLLGRDRPAIAEIGHLRPGPTAVDPHDTVESIASGWGIAATARRLLSESRGTATSTGSKSSSDAVREILAACNQDASSLTTVDIAMLAQRGNGIALEAIDRGVCVLGWAIAQMITLLAPETVVVGGGVSLIGESLFLQPLRNYVSQYVFPPLSGSYRISPAELSEQVVVYGAIALAAGNEKT